ncbi:MAG: outer membrane lipoprotein-sorting protein [Terriglobia bacterium]
MNASAAELITDINFQSRAVRTITATVDLAPTAGSVYSGVIQQYRDVRGFILAERPGWIRMQGQAPVVRTDIFDMASDGQKFQVFIPSKQKFIVGSTAESRAPQNSLENLRPQHIAEALLLQPVDAARDQDVIEEAEEGAQRFYVLDVLGACDGGRLYLKRKVWFDRSNLSIARVQLYGAKGSYQEDIHYSFYEDFGGIHYPRRIEITRPAEDYSLSMSLESATFNQDIPASKFVLKPPATAQLVVLKTPPASGGGPCGQ